MTHLLPDPDPEMTRYYYHLSGQLWSVFPPILLATGTVGNIMSILVLSRKAMRRSNAAIYLIVLAIVDMLVLYTGLLRHWIKESFKVDVRHLGEASCKIHAWLVYSSLDISVWVLVALTFERLVSVYLPHKVKKHCTMMTSFLTLGVICVVLLIINSHFFYGLGHVYGKRQAKWKLIEKCSFKYPGFEYFGTKIWPWIDLCLYSLVPLSIIIVCNIAIVVKVLISQRRARRVYPSTTLSIQVSSQGQGQDSRSKKVSSMTAMLVVLNVVLLMTTMPVSAYLIAEPYVYAADISKTKVAQMRLVWAVVNLLQYTNNSINFLLYCLSGSRFREELRAMFRWKRKVAPLNQTNSNVSELPLNRFRRKEGQRPTSGESQPAEGGSASNTTFLTATSSCPPHRVSMSSTQPPPSSNPQPDHYHPSPLSTGSGSPPPYNDRSTTSQEQNLPAHSTCTGIPMQTLPARSSEIPLQQKGHNTPGQNLPAHCSEIPLQQKEYNVQEQNLPARSSQIPLQQKKHASPEQNLFSHSKEIPPQQKYHNPHQETILESQKTDNQNASAPNQETVLAPDQEIILESNKITRQKAADPTHQTTLESKTPDNSNQAVEHLNRDTALESKKLDNQTESDQEKESVLTERRNVDTGDTEVDST